MRVDDDLRALVAPGEWVDFVAVAPALDASWQVAPKEVIAQQHCAAALPVADGSAIVPLGEVHAEQMLALTRLVYPGYFRPRTRELGNYIGIFAEGQLIAMAGERMQIGEWQEISAVCTHPDHLGRGHARRLIAILVNSILERGQRPFLHVSVQNERALALYRTLGFETRTEIELWLAQRVG